MLLRGSMEHTRKQLQNEFTEADADVAISGAAQGVTVTIATTRKNLVPVLRLVSEVLRRPAFPEAEFEQLKRSALLSTANRGAIPIRSPGTRLIERCIPTRRAISVASRRPTKKWQR